MKLKKIQYNINYILIIVIVLEIYLLYEKKSSLEIFKIKLNNIFNFNFEFYHIPIIIIILSFISISIYICYLFKINIICYFTLIILYLILYLEYQIDINKSIYKKDININNLYEIFNTGDIVMFDIPRKNSSIVNFIPTYFFGINHVGIIYKINNEIYLLECDSKDNYCYFSKKKKNGVALSKLKDKIYQNESFTFFVKTNIHNYINNETVFDFIKKYGHISYMENNFNCITTIMQFFKETNLLKDANQNILLYVYYEKIFDKNLYNFPFEYEIYKLK